jgi:hypothetical protein
MEYNTCGTCGAKDGRAGLLIGTELSNHVHECLNCHDTRESGTISIHTNLVRTDKETQRTMEILRAK